MSRDRIIQMSALAVMLVAISVCGKLLPTLLDQADEHSLRYTDTSVEGAPPFVALGTAIGAVRGLIVDYLWIKVHIMKQRGLLYEVMADSELITKLQPRFASVWAFHGHNMAYNISVATHTQEERWEWVQQGIRLVRNEGIRHNPNDLELHKNLAWWHAHKIEGVSDDGHLFYKTQFGREWHYLLGEPPVDATEREAWIKAIADAPSRLRGAIAAEPELEALISDLEEVYRQFGQELKLDKTLLFRYGNWIAIRGQSATADILGYLDEFRAQQPIFREFDRIAGDPARAKAWKTLLLHVRKRVLIDEYNMEPDRMYRYTVELGPIDWRHGQAHALYWSRRGEEVGNRRLSPDPNEAYKIMNNDRIQLQAMQGLARSGKIYLDPFSSELPSRFPDPRWIDAIHQEWDRLYVKNYDVRGAGADSLIAFYKNFMGSSIREWYRAGEREKAQELMDRGKELFGSGGQRAGVLLDPQWEQPLDVFVMNQVRGEYAMQPHIAPSEVAASLRYGYVEGLGNDREELIKTNLQFCRTIIKHFKENEYNNYVNKFGRGRMAELINILEDSIRLVFAQVMVDRSIPLPKRVTIWSKADSASPRLRGWTYDLVRPNIERELNGTPWGRKYTIDEILPPPANLVEMRTELTEMRRRYEQERAATIDRDTIQRK